MTTVLPLIGSAGSYSFASPFEIAGVNNVEYVCKEIRRISGYLANNEDIKQDIYVANSVSDAIYDEDVLSDAYIVSLQSLSGHWLRIPARFILSYPSTNGVPYRSVMISAALPSIPVSKDLTVLTSEISDIIAAAIGVPPQVRVIETSKVVQLSSEDHLATVQRRAAATLGVTTLTAKNHVLQEENALLIQKIKALEDYIIAKGL